jgi:hypothetical protein
MLKPEGFQQMPAHADKWADWEEQCRETIRPAVQQEYPLSKSRCGLCVD